MIILTPDIETKSVYVIPRNNDFSVFQITDDSTNIPQTFDITGWIDHDYYVELEVDFTEELIENHFYDLVLFDDTENVIFKDRIFITSQEIDTFSVNSYPDNSKKYKSNQSNNTYLTYGE